MNRRVYSLIFMASIILPHIVLPTCFHRQRSTTVMPIEVESEIRVFGRDEFHALAHQVLGIGFDIQNEFGRLLNESVYATALRHRCSEIGILPAEQEVEIRLSHAGFVKHYFMDLLFAFGLMVETKAVESLSNSHLAQTIHYLMLTGMKHGLLLNMRSERVTHQFVSTTLTLTERRQFTVHEADWKPINEASRWLKDTVVEILADWGAFLEISVYREAVIYFLGGADAALRKIPIFDGNRVVGVEDVCLICEDTALAFTAKTDDQRKMRDHLQRLLDHTRLACIQWVNFNRRDITFETLLQANRD